MTRDTPAATERLFLVSIDTEEDNWQPAREGLGCTNVARLPQAVAAFQGMGIRPTLFVTYAVLQNAGACEILRDLAQEDGVEIGAHLHPWNTPPMTEPMRFGYWMLNNLPGELQRQKVRTLFDRFSEVFGQRPASFRAGRFALGHETVEAVVAAGFTVDSSVTPFIDWRPYEDGPDFTGAPVQIYRLGGSGDPRRPRADGPLIEVPLSSGYTRLSPQRWGRVDAWLRNPSAGVLHVPGLLSRLRLLHKGFVTPEAEAVSDMVDISRRLIENGAGHVHAFFHSPSLVPGLGPFSRTPGHVDRLMHRLETLIERLSAHVSLAPATVTEAARAQAAVANPPPA